MDDSNNISHDASDPVFCGDVDASMIDDRDDDGEGPMPRDDNDDPSEDDAPRRHGTIASARFNMLSTMVGGGSLSLPLAFAKSGNGLVGPLLLLVVAYLTEFCFKIHVGSARLLHSPTTTRPGSDSFESVTSAALGKHMQLVSMALVTAMCFFGTVGYAVLLRDMLQPVTDAMWHPHHDDTNNATAAVWMGDVAAAESNKGGPTVPNNLTMLVVVLLMTPLCALKTLTALQRFGAASMLSVLVLGMCVLYRSVQCNYDLWKHQPSIHDHNSQSVWEAFQLFPDSWMDVLDVFPLYVSCFVCHYNLLPVHNDLKDPTPIRVQKWLGTTVGYATAFYMVMGISGSAYGHCTASGRVQSGNILLDFPEDDPLLLVGRLCLAVTLALAFPMLTIPARDIVLRSSFFHKSSSSCEPRREDGDAAPENPTTPTDDLTEPLLSSAADVEGGGAGHDAGGSTSSDPSLGARLITAIVVFWSAAAVASCVRSIDVVWDLLGSSLSILLSYLIPCAAYLAIANKHDVQVRADDDDNDGGMGGHDLSPPRLSRWLATALLVAYVPLMVISTANAVRNTFFLPPK